MVRADSLRKHIYNLWVENPYTTALRVCKKLHLNYKQHGNYANKLLSEFRSYHNFGSPLKAHPSPHRRVFVWRGVRGHSDVMGPEVARVKNSGGVAGWRWVDNRNDMWVFRDDVGSIHWYCGGLVRLFLRGEVQLARAKELFCRAFLDVLGEEETMRLVGAPLREEAKEWVFELGAPLPRFDIRQFERSHGLRIYADRSHPTAIEIRETEPFWIDEFRQVTGQFGLEIQEHMNLIKLWQQQASVSLRLLKKKSLFVKKRKKKPKPFDLKEWLRGVSRRTAGYSKNLSLDK